MPSYFGISGRKMWLASGVTLLLCLLSSLGVYGLPRGVPPNIIFTMADDLGYGDVGYNGGNACTPNLDAMASGPHTLHLTRYYSGGPVCSPTRGTVLTGRNHNRYCVWSANTGSDKDDFVRPETMPLPTSEITVAEILKKQGYQTAIFGKWHLGDLKAQEGGNKKWPVSHPGMHGFDEWLVTLRSAPTTNLNCACYNETKAMCPLGHYTSDPPCSNYYTITDKKGDLESLPDPVNGDDSHFILEQFEEFLEKATKSGQPFFAYLPFHAVHIRYIAAMGYIEEYASSPKNYSMKQIDYYGALSALDDSIGQLRQLLVKYNVSNNTMLWFTSDNGPEDNQPGVTAGFRGRKRSLYEGGIRLPGLIEWPSMVTKNRKTNFPVMSSDLLPTVCDIVGVKPPSDRPIDGVSILPFIKEEVTTRNSSMKWAYNVNGDFDKNKYQAAISDDQYKLYAMYNNGEMSSAELYDLTKDPYEQTDIKDKMSDVHNKMKEDLEKWHKSIMNSAKNVVKCYSK